METIAEMTMDGTAGETVWGRVIARYRELAGLSRPALSARIREAGVTEVADTSIEAYEKKGVKPTERAARALDAALGTGPAIARACGYGEPVDLEAEISTLRARLALTDETIGRLSDAVQALTEEVRRLGRPPRPL